MAFFLEGGLGRDGLRRDRQCTCASQLWKVTVEVMSLATQQRIQQYTAARMGDVFAPQSMKELADAVNRVTQEPISGWTDRLVEEPARERSRLPCKKERAVFFFTSRSRWLRRSPIQNEFGIR